MPVNIIVPIISALFSLLLKFLDKNSDNYIDVIFGKLSDLISAKAGKSAAVVVSTNPNVYVEFSKNGGDISKRLAPADGVLLYKENIDRNDKIYIKAYGEGYKTEDMTVVIDNEFVTYCVSLKLEKAGE